MSQEHVSLLERSVEAFNRRDGDAVETLWHPEGEFTSAVSEIEGTGGVYRASEIRMYMADLDALFEGWRVEEANCIEVGDNCVVQIHRVTGRAIGSGVPIDQRLGVVWTFKDGLIFRGRVFLTPQDALDAAGVSE
jgi:ketosteroid isomerase-like protein